MNINEIAFFITFLVCMIIGIILKVFFKKDTAIEWSFVYALVFSVLSVFITTILSNGAV